MPKTEKGDLEWKAVIDNFDAANDFITNDGPDFYFMTTKNAPKYKVIKVNVDTLEGYYNLFYSDILDYFRN